jgi:hypothetical protein
VRRSRKSANPFYVLLILSGLSFVITTTAYVVMAFRDAHANEESVAEVRSPVAVNDAHPLIEWMRRHGNAALLTELGLLAICTFAAIGTDGYWQRRADSQRSK